MTKIVIPAADPCAEQLAAPALIASLTATALSVRHSQFEPAFDRHSRDQDRYFAARDALQAIAFPAELVVPAKHRHMVAFAMTFSDGTIETREPEPETVRLERPETILAWCDGDAARAAPYLAHLTPWLEASEALRQELAAAETAMGMSSTLQVTAGDAMGQAALAILKPSVLSLRDIRAKIDGYCRVLCDQPDVTTLDCEEDCRALLEALVRDLSSLDGDAAGDAGSDWRQAFDAYQAAEIAYRALGAIDDEALDAMHRTLDPACRAPSLHQRDSIRWSSIEELDDDILLAPDAKAALRSRAETAIAQRSRYFKEGYTQAQERRDAELERLGDIREDAFDRLLDMAPPNASALAFVVERRIWWLDDDKVGIGDPGYVAFCLNSYVDAAYPVQTYLDVLHLAGRRYPVAEALTFNPVAWIKAYEATDGLVGEISDALIIAYPKHDMLQARRLRAELARSPWKYRAVHLAAQKRREEGGDPFRDARGGVGDRDHRSPACRFHSFVRRADHIGFAIDQAAGQVIPHLERIDNTLSSYVPAAFGVPAASVDIVAAE